MQRLVTMPDLEKLADQLLPLVCERLRRRVPADAQGLAAEAAATPGLDDVCLSILADWLDDHKHPAIAARVRTLRAEGGDLIVLHAPKGFSAADHQALQDDAEKIEQLLADRGKRVVAVVLQHGLTIERITCTPAKARRP